MDEFIATLGDTRTFTTLDAFNVYCQIGIAKEGLGKTSFVCYTGQFQCVRMPFDLTSVPATSQMVLDVILARLKSKTCLVYIHDVIIFSKSVEERIQ